jgi:hypothetical protein
MRTSESHQQRSALQSNVSVCQNHLCAASNSFDLINRSLGWHAAACACAIPQVVRIELDGGQRIVGVKWPIELAGEVGSRLEAAAAGKAAAAHPVEAAAPVDPVSVKRAAKKAQQTMTSFFSAASASASASASAAAAAATAPTVVRKAKSKQKGISGFFIGS